MKKSGVILLVIVIVALVAGLGVVASKYQHEKARYAETHDAEQAVRSQFNSALEAIAEIQDSLSAIAPEGSAVRELSQAREATPAAAATEKERMLSTIANLKQSIQDTGDRIHKLEKDLSGTRTEVAGLRHVIDNLKRSVAEKETMVAALSARVDSLNVAVAGLKSDVSAGKATIAAQETTIAVQQDTISQKQQEIATVHYVVGTKDDLMKKGIIVQEGGFIGIGKTPTLSGSFDPSVFTSTNTDETTDIGIKGREPRVLSAQPKSSYAIQANGADSSTLRITDPASFRRVRYLVVMVK